MSRRTTTILLGLTTTYLILLASASLNWRMMHDPVMVVYPAMLIERFHLVPYRDFFDVNLPATYFIFRMAGKVLGFTDLGFRLLDVTWLAATLALTWLWLRPAGRLPAWGGAVGAGIAYLQFGPGFSMERDFFMLLFIVAAFLILRRSRTPLAWAAAGACIGITLLIKPQGGLFLVPVWLAGRSSAAPASRPASLTASSAAMAAGLGLPVLLAASWLAQNRALAPLLDMASNYYPLYTKFFENRIVLGPLQRLNILAAQLPRLGGQGLWLIPSAIGIVLGIDPARDPADRTITRSILACTLVAIALPAISGQFFPYHWMPLQYFAICGAALCLREPAPGRGRLFRWLPPLVFFAALAVAAVPQKGLIKPIAGEKLGSPKTVRADAIAAIIGPRLRPGDRVQPLDWTSGALQAMLELETPPATSFIFTVSFHHHVGNPYIQGLRKRFLTEMKSSFPRFIIRIDADRPWFVGPLTDMTFLEFDNWMAANYHEIARGEGFVIFERSAPPGGQ